MIYNYLLLVCWLVFISYWAISAMGAKKDAYRAQNWWSGWTGRIIIVAIIVILLGQHWFAPAATAWQNWVSANMRVLGPISVALAACGIALAVWARRHLGTNWSSRPAFKESHELVTTGPYAIVRHPIYTGVSMAVLGSALISGLVWALICVSIIITFIARIHVEERLMLQLFPNEYPNYKARTKALIPWVW